MSNLMKVRLNALLALLAGPFLSAFWLVLLGLYPLSGAVQVLTSWGFIAFFVVSVVLWWLLSRLYLRRMIRWLDIPDETGLEKAQVAVVLYQKSMIAAPILLSLFFGFLIPRTVSIPQQARGPFFAGCIAWIFLVGLFFYIRYIQELERLTWDIPFSEKHQSMPYLTRNLLIILFTFVGLTILIVVATQSSLRTYGADDVRGMNLAIIPSILVGIFFAVADSYLLGKGVSQRLQAVRGFVSNLAEGDLTGDPLPTMSRDEFGELIHRCNMTLGYLKTLVNGLKTAVSDARHCDETMTSVSAETAETLNTIRAGAGDVGEGMTEMTDQVTQARGLLDSLTTDIVSVVSHIDEQAAMSEESTAALTQMTASVNAIGQVTRERLNAAQQLADHTRKGGENLDLTVSTVKDIHSGIETITEITELLGAIASQTNLLAMNAAIEAAHAGEAGRGFSVVSDEIRKLAESASENSKGIGEAVAHIVDAIRKSSELGGETSSLFSDMAKEIDTLVTSLSEIENGVQELGTGAEQVMKSMVDLREHSQGLRDDAGRMKTETGSVGAVMENLDKASSRAAAAGSDISTRTNAAAALEEQLATSSRTLGEVAATLERRVRRFKT